MAQPKSLAWHIYLSTCISFSIFRPSPSERSEHKMSIQPGYPLAAYYSSISPIVPLAVHDVSCCSPLTKAQPNRVIPQPSARRQTTACSNCAIFPLCAYACLRGFRRKRQGTDKQRRVPPANPLSPLHVHNGPVLRLWGNNIYLTLPSYCWFISPCHRHRQSTSRTPLTITLHTTGRPAERKKGKWEPEPETIFPLRCMLFLATFDAFGMMRRDYKKVYLL
jgi:hypothetical protein